MRLNRRKGNFVGMKTYTMGANADSYYEYLLKMWLLKQQKVLLVCIKAQRCSCPNASGLNMIPSTLLGVFDCTLSCSPCSAPSLLVAVMHARLLHPPRPLCNPTDMFSLAGFGLDSGRILLLHTNPPCCAAAFRASFVQWRAVLHVNT